MFLNGKTKNQRNLSSFVVLSLKQCVNLLIVFDINYVVLFFSLVVLYYDFVLSRTVTEVIPHTFSSIEMSQHLMNFFIEETRRNNNSYSEQQLNKDIIYQYQTTFVPQSGFETVYLFN